MEEIAKLFEELQDAIFEEDFEIAHSIENKIWEKSLELITKGTELPKSVAKLALETKKWKFPRWCA